MASLSANAEMRAVRAESDAREKARYDQAYREAFGISLTQSAEDRALRAEFGAAAASGELGPAEAQARMNSALAIGDSLVARALAEIAFEHRADSIGADAWTAVSEMYGGSAPAADRVMSAVYQLARAIPPTLDQFRGRCRNRDSHPCRSSARIAGGHRLR